MNFNGIDLNLLVAFDALVKERHVTRAAARVGVSQPAMSAALLRLRKHFSDVLFRRSADGLKLTPKARELAESITPVLEQLKVLLVKDPEFEAHTARITFTLGLSDYPTFVLLPTLMSSLALVAPHIELRVRSFEDRDHAIDLLDAGSIDVAIGVPPTKSDSRILSRTLLTDEFVTILRHGHPALQQDMGVREFIKLKHVLVSPEGDSHGLVDKALSSQGLSRTLSLSLPQMFAVPAIISKTDMAATLLRRVALQAMPQAQLQLLPSPVTLPIISFDLIWHRHNDNHAAQRWLRDFIESIARQI